MGKVKVKKKDARIDMTAMSDVTVLLLTFFMLTSTFLQKEPVQVITPSSISPEVVPDSKLMTILVSPKGQVFMEITGSTDSTLSSEKVRALTLVNFGKAKNITFDQKEIATFSKCAAFGIPASQLKDWLSKPVDVRDKALKEGPGIPISQTAYEGTRTEFQDWVQAYADAMMSFQDQGADDQAFEDIRSGKGIAVKADATTPYRMVELVMNNLQSMNRNKFTLMTALKKDEGE